MVTCAHCRACIPRGKTGTCGKCKRAHYCGQKCQRAAWPAHKKTCKAAAEAAGARPAHRKTCKAAAEAAGALSAKRTHEATLQIELYRRIDAGDYGGAMQMQDEVTAAVEAIRWDATDARFPMRAATTCSTIGSVQSLRGDYRAALKMFDTALKIADELEAPNDPRKRAFRAQFANALRDCGRVDDALAMFRGIVARDQGGDAERSCGFESLAACLCRRGEFAEAASWYERSLAVPNTAAQTIFTLNSLWNAMLQQHKHAEAYGVYMRGRQQALALGNMQSATELAVSMAECKWMEAYTAAPSSAPNRPIAELEDILYNAMHVVKAHAIKDNAIFRRISMLNAFLQSVYGNSDGAATSMVAMLCSFSNVASSHCWGCGQAQTPECPLKMCRDCRLARFCNKSCQRMASCSAAFVHGTCDVQHRRLCPLLRAHRKTVEAGSASKAGRKLREQIQKFVHGTMAGSRAFGDRCSAALSI